MDVNFPNRWYYKIETIKDKTLDCLCNTLGIVLYKRIGKMFSLVPDIYSDHQYAQLLNGWFNDNPLNT